SADARALADGRRALRAAGAKPRGIQGVTRGEQGTAAPARTGLAWGHNHSAPAAPGTGGVPLLAVAIARVGQAKDSLGRRPGRAPEPDTATPGARLDRPTAAAAPREGGGRHGFREPGHTDRGPPAGRPGISQRMGECASAPGGIRIEDGTVALPGRLAAAG